MDNPRITEALRVVLDTNVLISSTLWDRSASQKVLYNLIRMGAHIYISEDIIDEYLVVLIRDFRYTKDEAIALVEKIKLFTAMVAPNKKMNVIKEDDTDNRIIECAVAAKATCILSYDKHLLSLREYEGIRIIKPEQMVVR